PRRLHNSELYVQGLDHARNELSLRHRRPTRTVNNRRQLLREGDVSHPSKAHAQLVDLGFEVRHMRSHVRPPLPFLAALHSLQRGLSPIILPPIKSRCYRADQGRATKLALGGLYRKWRYNDLQLPVLAPPSSVARKFGTKSVAYTDNCLDFCLERQGYDFGVQRLSSGPGTRTRSP